MDYLDRAKEIRQNALLMVGYVLVALAISIATLILLYQAYGFGLNKNGKVIQNGLVFFSSHPSPADIYLNGSLNSAKTNTRLALTAGIYRVKLTRDGYFDWQRTVDLPGGSVLHYDYPFFFPKSLSSKKIQTFSAAPGFMTQSPDRRWLLVQKSDNLRDFIVFDLKNPSKPPISLSLPEAIVTKATASEGWQLGEWADDNQHVLLEHDFDGRSEYILVNRTDPAATLNLNNSLSANPTKLTLNNKKYDQYYSYDAASASLQKLSLKTPQPTPLLQRVLAYKSYSDDTILYVTDNGAPAGRVLVKLLAGDNTITVRNLTAGSNYVLDLAKYSGTMYTVIGSTKDNRAYIFKDPLGQAAAQPGRSPLSLQVLRVDELNYLSFSASAQFIMAENGNHFAVYDIENGTAYNYHTSSALDSPQPHATWMDGNRLVYVSGGKLVVMDYDNLNPHTLMPASSNYLAAFAPDYKYVYNLAPDKAVGGQIDLNQTALLVQKDL